MPEKVTVEQANVDANFDGTVLISRVIASYFAGLTLFL